MNRFSRYFRPALALLLLLVLLSSASAAPSVTGRVYVNAVMHRPLAGVPVSDGLQVVLTDAQGHYSLPLPATGALIRVAFPTGYWPVGNRWFQRVPGALGDGTCNFPLEVRAETSPWTMISVSDIHHIVPANALMQAFCNQVNALPIQPAFLMAAGDLVADSNPIGDPAIIRRVFADYAQSMAPLQAPLFQLPGNHDHPGVTGTLSPQDPMYGLAGYEALVGPPWYSFDYAGVHVVALDATLINPTPQTKINAGAPAECLAWLRADLALTPAGEPLLVFMHEPPEQWSNATALPPLLAGHKVLGIFCGHTHQSKEYAWQGYQVHQDGALSGAWWSGPCPDGKPRGFRTLTVTPQSVTTEYVPAAGAPKP